MAKQQQEPFHFTFSAIHARLLSIEYVGYLGAHDAEQVHKTNAYLQAAPKSVGIIYTLSKLTGFDRSQIKTHVDLYQRQSAKIRGTALVGASPGAHFAAITAGLMSKMHLKSFVSFDDAERWLESLP